MKYDPLQSARDAKKKEKLDQKQGMNADFNINNSSLILEDPRENESEKAVAQNFQSQGSFLSNQSHFMMNINNHLAGYNLPLQMHTEQSHQSSANNNEAAN